MKTIKTPYENYLESLLKKFEIIKFVKYNGYALDNGISLCISKDKDGKIINVDISIVSLESTYNGMEYNEKTIIDITEENIIINEDLLNKNTCKLEGYRQINMENVNNYLNYVIGLFLIDIYKTKDEELKELNTEEENDLPF